MPGIYVMAVITLAASAGLWGGLVYFLSGRRSAYLWLILSGLPLSALVNLCVKKPLGLTVSAWAGIPPPWGPTSPVWFLTFLLLLSPVFEEPVKLLPLLFPSARRTLSGKGAALWAGMALGIGYGLGEATYLAYGIARNPHFARMAWYLFTGYFGERLIVCFLHGVMTAVAVSGIRRGLGPGVLGVLAAMGLHGLINIGAALYQFKVIPLAATQLPFIASLILLVIIFEGLRRTASREPGAADKAEEVVYYQRTVLRHPVEKA